MSSSVFVRDAAGTPLMPTSAAYARRLLQRAKARWIPHHAFPIIQLSQVVTVPVLRPIVVGIHIHLQTAELIVVAAGDLRPFPLQHLVVDLRTDLPIRIRRRAGHRRRRRARGRYQPMRRYGQPFKRRRPSLARSAWGRVVRPRLRRTRGSRPRSISPTMRWRAQAIVRVIAALQALLPLSHVVILSPRQTRELFHPNTAALTLRQRLIDTYGKVTVDGTRVAMCAYCGTTEGRIEAEHILPASRGGTDGWNNRVLACASCNARKGNRTPDEANMPVIVELTPAAGQQNRAGVYARWTARSLAIQLQPHIAVSWPQST
jgi:5-methylcytosine-specific restriction endonuclease McrA